MHLPYTPGGFVSLDAVRGTQAPETLPPNEPSNPTFSFPVDTLVALRVEKVEEKMCVCADAECAEREDCVC